jgi:hypothetical protein
LVPSMPAFADGAFFIPTEQDIYQPSQKALILYADGREDLVLSVRYEGSATEFGWVIPVPNRPEVDVADPELFWELSILTWLEMPFPSGGAFVTSESQEPDVEVLEEKTVGPYDIAVLSAEEPTALIDWLNSNGYSLPEAGEKIIDEYINKNWYFVATKIHPGEEAVGLAQGTIEPLVVSFESDRIVYPLRITSLSSDYCEVLLYVFTEQAIVPGQYQFLSLNNAEQVYYFVDRENNVFYIEYRRKLQFREALQSGALMDLLYYLEFGEYLDFEEDYEKLDEQLSQLEAPFAEVNHLTKLRATVSADEMIDIELIPYESKDYLDSDGDGWSDAEEALSGSDPYEVDTDGDGILDPVDSNPLERGTLPDWSLPVAFAGTLVIAFVIWLLTWRKVRQHTRG